PLGGETLYKSFKRLLDIVFSLILLIVLSPIIIITAILVRTKLGSPIIFTQERVGLNNEIFTLRKFRSMTNETDENGELLSKDERLTKFGKLIRSTSLDELPELFNILKGDMSFIGPRPLLVEYLPRYNSEQIKRHNVRPGLTSYTAVNGRATLTWPDRLALDVWYVKNMSFLLDLKILIKTFITVFKRENIDGTRGKFMGNEQVSEEDK